MQAVDRFACIVCNGPLICIDIDAYILAMVIKLNLGQENILVNHHAQANCVVSGHA